MEIILGYQDYAIEEYSPSRWIAVRGEAQLRGVRVRNDAMEAIKGRKRSPYIQRTAEISMRQVRSEIDQPGPCPPDAACRMKIKERCTTQPAQSQKLFRDPLGLNTLGGVPDSSSTEKQFFLAEFDRKQPGPVLVGRRVIVFDPSPLRSTNCSLAIWQGRCAAE
ncbi:uncharacterized protein LAESUDRAFT_711705 [Laetiporus sulphureus 93-53]|uniref:Uncharacterized protein n=1 Tax=Laetiporus sulphureus 93-53 TaxID=1314785 RepID=A0A165GMK4_9APHY|nr:uncharacterized protein LAESUDRAFT_711705 [Laetiporus sulphureus 93-53]KZT10557.1 hypothetical protein LAESUDRAFT_711705 [Laetiporus sulphureus 93-53]